MSKSTSILTKEQQQYDEWFARKVAEGRADCAAGRVLSNEVAEAEANERRRKLLAKLNKTN